MSLIEGSLGVKLPTSGQMQPQSWEDFQQRGRERESEEKEDQTVRKGRKVANAVFFQCFEAPEGQK